MKKNAENRNNNKKDQQQFEEHTEMAVLGASPTIQDIMRAYLKNQVTSAVSSLQAVLEVAVRAWALGSLSQSQDNEIQESSSSQDAEPQSASDSFSDEQILEHLHTALTDKTLECAVLDRHGPGSSKYRNILQQELHSLLPKLNQTTN